MTEWSAPQLLETTGSYWQGCAIMAGVELDVFNLLNDKSDDLSGLAVRLGADPRALGMLLRALAALGLLECDDEGAYRPSLAANAFLVSDSEQYMGNIISHQHHLVESWARLHESVLSGQPVRQRSSFGEAAWRQSFLLGMQNLANLVAPQLIPRIDIGDRRTLLDLGGGPGSWSIHFCRHHPQLSATVFDLPTSRKYALSEINNAGMDERIDFVGGDFLTDDLPGGRDLIWMSHILHGEGPANCRRLIHKAAFALAQDGLLVIHEFILDDSGPGPTYPALFALNMLLGTEKGAAYTEGELGEMLAEAGFMNLRRLPLPAQSRSGILLAQKA